MDILGPKLSPDYYSLSPADPMLINYDMKYGYHDKKGESCSENTIISASVDATYLVLKACKMYNI